MQCMDRLDKGRYPGGRWLSRIRLAARSAVSTMRVQRTAAS
jgi:hypothetical protein